ncbi:hypothetical protein KM043_001532 [Ampulex compressa]|nr:hypothetical protein KM043_001532 [Ampulex compressa]
MSKRKRIKVSSLVEDKDDDDDDTVLNRITDSEDEYTETERNLLEKARRNRSAEDYDSDDEVYAFHGANDEDDAVENEEQADSMESDIEGLENDYDVPSDRAWGKKKKLYYSTDYVDPDYASADQKDLANAEVEEREAANIQKRLAEQLDDADFGLEFVQLKEHGEEEVLEHLEGQVVKTDLTKLGKRQKLALMQTESPEFTALVADFKDRMTETRDVLLPFLQLADSGGFPNCPAIVYVKTKHDLLLNYCTNISFYLMLKAKRLPVNSHPVIKRLAQYRQLLGQLESSERGLLSGIRNILNAEMEGKSLYNTTNGLEHKIGKNKKILNATRKVLAYRGETGEDKVTDETLLGEQPSLGEENTDDDQYHLDGEDNVGTGTDMLSEGYENIEKRAITYQIAKNKGLTPHRKKELRNPRVKHRNKYRKAKIRRKGAVREVRRETKRYAGEISGIKASVKKSIKLK